MNVRNIDIEAGVLMNLSILEPENRNAFIEENKGFIYACTEHICKRKLDWNNDDELSISLMAFNKACDTFNNSKGNFYSYAGIVIKNSLIDYFRKNKNIPVLEFEDQNEKKEYIDLKISVSEYEKGIENKNRAEEIMMLSNELKEYGLSFEMLVKSSPSHEDTRNMLLNIAFLCTKNNMIMEYIKRKKQLPVNQIVSLTNTKRKKIEKWRRYLLALMLILSGKSYQYIKSYLNIKAGEKND